MTYLEEKFRHLVNNEEKVRWRYKVLFDASTLASGVYFYRLQVIDPESSSGQGFVETKKMMVLK